MPPPAAAPQPTDRSAKPGTALALRKDPAASREPASPQAAADPQAAASSQAAGSSQAASPQAALEEFARDLRELRAKAELDYPEMEELSHYTMKTLASAASGLRLPTLPVTIAYVRACGGNVPEWEDRWQQLAAMIEPKGDRALPQPEDALADAPGATSSGADRAEPGPQGPPGPPGGGQVYVITSAVPRRPHR